MSRGGRANKNHDHASREAGVLDAGRRVSWQRVGSYKVNASGTSACEVGPPANRLCRGSTHYGIGANGSVLIKAVISREHGSDRCRTQTCFH